MDKKIENHEYNLRQFTYIATRWKLEVIYKSSSKTNPFGSLEIYTIHARKYLEDFRDRLMIEFGKSENNIGLKISISDRFLLGINQYYIWYDENIDKIISLYGQQDPYTFMYEIMKSTEREINLYFPPSKNQANNTDKGNPYPNIFKDNVAFAVFERLNNNYKNDKYLCANYSFIFYAMSKDKLIDCRGVDFVKFLSTEYQIEIDRTDRRQLGKNKRTDLYNLIKTDQK